MTTQTLKQMPLEQVTAEFLSRHDKAGPRYTSYPTAVEFNDNFTPDNYLARLKEANKKGGAPLSLYVHIPFCERRCSFCGCNVIISKRREQADRYLSYLYKEITMLAQALPNRRELMQYHWGGGTPTYLNVDQMRALFATVKQHFLIGKDAEVAIEIDPDVTSLKQLDVARELGFNRLSIGVQDFDVKVLAAVNRAEAEKKTKLLLSHARKIGFKSVNLDLIYGLPHQTPQSFGITLDKVLALRPDRLAMYSFAFVPWIKGNQKQIQKDQLPSRDAKFALFSQAIKAFLNAGYLQIGMDHFALPDDEMGRAAQSRTLYRNFMGYTVHSATDMIGVGVSSIGAIDGAFAQNFKKTVPYYRAIDEGHFPVERGYVLNKDDLVRQRVITHLMCNFHVDFSSIEQHFDIDFKQYFKAELYKLTATEKQMDRPFVRVWDNGIEITPLGRLFVRNVCMVFDVYLKNKTGETTVFSRTV